LSFRLDDRFSGEFLAPTDKRQVQTALGFISKARPLIQQAARAIARVDLGYSGVRVLNVPTASTKEALQSWSSNPMVLLQIAEEALADAQKNTGSQRAQKLIRDFRGGLRRLDLPRRPLRRHRCGLRGEHVRLIHTARWAVLALLFISFPALAAEPETAGTRDETLETAPPDSAKPLCPEGFVCLRKEVYAKVKAALAKLAKLEQTEPKIELDPVYIVTDRQGRVFSSGDDPEPASGEMTWGDFQVEFKWVPKLTVSQIVEDEWGFRPRVKAQLWFNFTDFQLDEFERFIDVGVSFEPLYVYWANLQIFVGIKSFGAAIGFDATKNFGFVGGISFLYRNIASPSPMAGIFFSFN
jgi:hypothetical protein